RLDRRRPRHRRRSLRPLLGRPRADRNGRRLLAGQAWRSGPSENAAPAHGARAPAFWRGSRDLAAATFRPRMEDRTMTRTDRILGGLHGSLVGDALGVPVEFAPRKAREADPVTGMRAYGTHHQPAGTWSDD